jgi:P4 family phage/plasmid primase-like protien
MSGLKLYDAGFKDLVSVIPPGSTLAEGTTIKPESLGKVPGVQKADGTWSGYPWATQDVHRATAKRWDASGANIGLIGSKYPGLDLDVDDEQLADVIHEFAVQQLGEAPVRLSRGSRKLLVYRAAVPFSRVALVITWKGRSHTCEWLCETRQYLTFGKHPSGVDYRWDGAPLWEWSPDDLAVVSGESARAFLETLGAALTSKGAQVELVGTGAAKAAPPSQEDLRAPSIEKLEDLAGKLPNREDREGYIEILYALKAAGGEEALPVALEWAARWEGGYNDPERVEADFVSLSGPYRVGWPWLQERAQAAGVYQMAREAFVADLEAPDGPREGSAPARVPYTDEWVVDRILPEVVDCLRYVHGAKTWYLWSGHMWRPDEGMGHQLLLREMLRGLCNELEAQGVALGKEGKAHRIAARRYQSAAGIGAVVDLLGAHSAVAQDAFDRDPYALNTPSGVVDLRTGAITPVTPGGMHARSTLVGPEGGRAPTWEHFMHDLTGGDRSLIRYLQKVAGYALTGDITEKKVWFVWGSDTDTGKSTFIRVLSAVVGNYAGTIDVEGLIGGRGDRVPADLAQLPGVRLVTATEPEAGRAWDEKRIKVITGGDVVNARLLYGQWFRFMPQFKILIVGNHEPEIRNVDAAMLNRIHIVPLNRRVPKEKIVKDLSDLLVREEGPRILQWIIDGCLAWQTEGLTPPHAVVAKTRDYEDIEDIFQAWVEEECELGETFTATRQELYSAWAVWCRQRGEDPGSEKTFKRKVVARKLPVTDRQLGERRLRGYQGIQLNLRVELGTDA